mgnify:CR=1 FL=1
MKISRTGHRYIDSGSGKTIDVWFPRSSQELKRSCLAEKVGIVKSDFITVDIESLDSPPQSTEEAYLRLHLLSECAVKPNEQNLEGIFSLLANVAWTSAGPVLTSTVDKLRDLISKENAPFVFVGWPTLTLIVFIFCFSFINFI